MNWSKIIVATEVGAGTQEIWRLTLQKSIFERDQLKAELTEVWRDFCQKIVPLNLTEWNQIRVDFCSDSGKIIFYTLNTGHRSQPALVAELTNTTFRDYVLERIFDRSPSKANELEVEALEKDFSILIASAALDADICRLFHREQTMIIFCMINDDEPFAEVAIAPKAT